MIVIAPEFGVLPLGIVRQPIDEIVEVTWWRTQHVHDLVDRQRTERGINLCLVDWRVRHHVPLLVNADHVRAGVRRGEDGPSRVAQCDAVVPPDPPGEMHSAAAVEVSHFVVGSDFADPGPRAHGHDGRQSGDVRRIEPVLLFRAGRAADRPDLAVGPRLLRDPADNVGAVLRRPHEERVGALGEEPATLILPHDGVAVLEKAGDKWSEQVPHVVRVDEIGDPDHHGRQILPRLPFWKEDEVVQPHAVAHGNHHHVFDLGVAVNVGLGLVGR